MPYRSYFLTPEGSVETGLSDADIQAAYESGEGSLWLDFDTPTFQDGEFIQGVFGFHPIAVDAFLDLTTQIPTVDDYGDCLFMVARGIDYTVDTRILSTTEMGIFLGHNFVITAHTGLLYNIESIVELVERDGLPLRRGPTFLTYILLDSLVQNLVPGIEGLGDWVDDIEDAVVERPEPSALEAILELKRSSFQLRRALGPQREMLNRLSRSEFSHVTGDAIPYYRDIYETILRIEGQNENLRGQGRHNSRRLPVAGGQPAERPDESPGRGGDGVHATGSARRNLRHELRVHPRAPGALGILRRAGGDGDPLSRSFCGSSGPGDGFPLGEGGWCGSGRPLSHLNGCRAI